jgi:hypothetical protein
MNSERPLTLILSPPRGEANPEEHIGNKKRRYVVFHLSLSKGEGRVRVL